MAAKPVSAFQSTTGPTLATTAKLQPSAGRGGSHMIERMVARANSDASLRLRGKFVDMVFELGIGDKRWLVEVDKGLVSAKPRNASGVEPQFSIRAGKDAWDDFCKPVPPPNSHDILGLFEEERLEIDGDMVQFMRYLLFLKLMLVKARETGDTQ
jgi:hypothetical protein